MSRNSSRALIPVLALALAPLTGSVAAQESNWRCGDGQGDFAEVIAGHTVRIASATDPDAPQMPLCRAQVLDAGGQVIFEAGEYALKLLERAKDVNGDGAADLVFEGYSGGAHCCWSYWLVSLRERPALLAAFGNQRPASFGSDWDGDGRLEITTADGGFDYFDGLSHAESVFPAVFLQLEDRRLRDVSHRFPSFYDLEIARARKRLTPALLQEFLQSDPSQEPKHRAYPIALEIVLAYLYSGREARAWQDLERLWPAQDRERIRELIRKTRLEGVLRWTAPHED